MFWDRFLKLANWLHALMGEKLRSWFQNSTYLRGSTLESIFEVDILHQAPMGKESWEADSKTIPTWGETQKLISKQLLFSRINLGMYSWSRQINPRPPWGKEILRSRFQNNSYLRGPPLESIFEVDKLTPGLHGGPWGNILRHRFQNSSYLRGWTLESIFWSRQIDSTPP